MNTLYFSLFCYAVLTSGLVLLPEHFWDQILLFSESVEDHFSRRKLTLPLVGEIHCGEALLLNIQEAESKITLGLKILPGVLYRFKFYTGLFEQLFESYRRLGVPIKKILPEIRRALSSDLQFERKILNETFGALMQFLMIGFTTWGFVFLSSFLIEILPSKTILFLMLTLQVSGSILFFIVMKYLKKKSFSHFSSALTELYLFSCFMEVGMPMNDVLKRSNILEGGLMNASAFSHFGIRTRNLIARMKETGLSPKEEIHEIINGLWHFQEETFTKFTKKVQVLKFTILACFYLPAYFLYLHAIFKFFMEQ
jgi:hypothetical protein